MARMIGVKLTGDAELARKLRGMKFRKGELTKALRPAAKLVLETARAEVPVNEGLLRKSIKVKTLKGNPATLVVRPTYGETKSKRTGKKLSAGYHAHLVEFGTKLARPATETGEPRKATINGKTVWIKTTGIMPAHPFMQPAFHKTTAKQHQLVRQEMTKLVNLKARQK